MELFTLLSFVDNQSFTELLQSWTGIKIAQNGELLVYFPEWKFRPEGTLSHSVGEIYATEVTRVCVGGPRLPE